MDLKKKKLWGSGRWVKGHGYGFDPLGEKNSKKKDLSIAGTGIRVHGHGFTDRSRRARVQFGPGYPGFVPKKS